MYLPTLTDEELLRYAETQTLTPLEAELVKRMNVEETEKDERIAELEQETKVLEEQIEELEVEVIELREQISESLA